MCVIFYLFIKIGVRELFSIPFLHLNKPLLFEFVDCIKHKIY